MGGILGGKKRGSGTNTTAPMEVGIRFQTSAYGLSVPLVYGRTRVPGNLIWYGDFTPIPHTTTTSSGGGGGKGGGGGNNESTNTTYTYTTSYLLALSEGKINKIGAMWVDKNYYPTNQFFTIFDGSDTQTPWGYLTSQHSDEALAYRGLGYAATAAYNLGDSANLPNHTFEVYGLLTDANTGLDDCNPAQILIDFLTNEKYGAGFPLNKISDLSNYSNFCLASNILLSPAIDSQRPAHEFITQLMLLTNSAVYYSEGVLKVVPYGDSVLTANGVTWTPNITPIYDITDDDYISDSGSDPVKVTRGATADAYNHVQIEFINRLNQYNVEVAEAKDLVNIDTYGLRTQEPIKAHEIADAQAARAISQMILQRVLYIRNTYEFTVSLKYCLLEPTDLVTLTDTYLGLDKHVVRILSIEENEDNTFLITAEDAPDGVYSQSLYPSQIGVGFTNDYNLDPGNTTTPIIFEPPDLLTESGLQLWIGAHGGKNWGGCQIWASYDGSSYQQIGLIRQPSRMGVITEELPAHTDPDDDNILYVDLQQSRGALSSGTQLDSDRFATLSKINDEYISYQYATLIGNSAYELTHLRRGAYGTVSVNHKKNERFLRIDEAIFKLGYTSDKIGQTLYLKFPAFNIYGAGLQNIHEVEAIQYKITGAALLEALPNVTNINSNYINSQGSNTLIFWDAVKDFRQPNIDYEIRIGESWNTAVFLARTPLTEITAQGNGTYWISAHYLAKGDISVYSLNAESIVISGAAIVKNVVASYSEYATNWMGNKTNLIQDNNYLTFDVNINFFSITDLFIEENIFNLNGATNGIVLNTFGSYELPNIHTINTNKVNPCNILISFVAQAVRVNQNFFVNNNLFLINDLFDDALFKYVNIEPQIAVAGSDLIFSEWKKYSPGFYNGQYFKSRFLVKTADTSVNVVIKDYSFSVDVPDRIESGTLLTNTEGTVIIYDNVFNGGNSGALYPLVQVTIVNAVQGDTAIVTEQSVTGFKVRVLNNGQGQVRNINWLAQGY